MIAIKTGISWHSFDFTPKGPKRGEIHLGWASFTNWEQKTAVHFLGAGFSWNSSARWTPLPRKSVENTKHSTRCLVSLRPFSDESSPILGWDSSNLWRIILHEQNKDPGRKSHHNPCEVLYFWHTLLQHSFTFSEGAIFKLNAISRERRCWK